MRLFGKINPLVKLRTFLQTNLNMIIASLIFLFFSFALYLLFIPVLVSISTILGLALSIKHFRPDQHEGNLAPLLSVLGTLIGGLCLFYFPLGGSHFGAIGLAFGGSVLFISNFVFAHYLIEKLKFK